MGNEFLNVNSAALSRYQFERLGYYSVDPKDSKDANRDLDVDGYTKVEEYLNELAGDLCNL